VPRHQPLYCIHFTLFVTYLLPILPADCCICIVSTPFYLLIGPSIVRRYTHDPVLLLTYFSPTSCSVLSVTVSANYPFIKPPSGLRCTLCDRLPGPSLNPRTIAQKDHRCPRCRRNGADYITTAKLMRASNVTSANAVSQSPGLQKTSKVLPKADVILPAPGVCDRRRRRSAAVQANFC